MNKVKSILIFGISILFAGCMKVSSFSDSIEINAPASVVFSVITNYESYDEVLPELHDTISIVSEEKEGLGVAWESTGTYKGHSFTTTWTVVGFVENSLVKMEDLKDGIGYTILQTEALDSNRTKYTMDISTKMYPPYEEAFFDIYRNEMLLVKAESERLYMESLEN